MRDICKNCAAAATEKKIKTKIIPWISAWRRLDIGLMKFHPFRCASLVLYSLSSSSNDVLEIHIYIHTYVYLIQCCVGFKKKKKNKQILILKKVLGILFRWIFQRFLWRWIEKMNNIRNGRKIAEREELWARLYFCLASCVLIKRRRAMRQMVSISRAVVCASRSVHFNQPYINADPCWPSSFMYHPTPNTALFF